MILWSFILDRNKVYLLAFKCFICTLSFTVYCISTKSSFLLWFVLGKEVVLLMQALNSLATPEEKLAALCKKYADLVSWTYKYVQFYCQTKMVRPRIRLPTCESLSASQFGSLSSDQLCYSFKRSKLLAIKENWRNLFEFKHLHICHISFHWNTYFGFMCKDVFFDNKRKLQFNSSVLL